MNKYELYELKDGKLHPTGIWARGHNISQAEKHLKKHYKGRRGPFSILVSHLTP